MDGNGTPVTWREARLLVNPIIEDVAEIKSDVKTLLAAHAGDEAVSKFQRGLLGAVVILVSSGIGTLLYLAVGG